MSVNNKWMMYYNPKTSCIVLDISKSFRTDNTKELEEFLNEIYGNLVKSNSTSAKLQKLWFKFIDFFGR